MQESPDTQIDSIDNSNLLLSRKTDIYDIFLYLISSLLLAYMCFTVVESRNNFSELLLQRPNPSTEIKLEEYQLQIWYQQVRYDFAMKSLLSNSFRSNMGFLVGVAICLMGVVLVVRQVRDTIEFNAKTNVLQDINLKTTSPGVLVTLLGTILVLTSILSRDDVSVYETQLYIKGSDSKTGGIIPNINKSDSSKTSPVSTHFPPLVSPNIIKADSK